MARITVEDCMKYIPNRFELTLAAVTALVSLPMAPATWCLRAMNKPTVIALPKSAKARLDWKS